MSSSSKEENDLPIPHLHDLIGPADPVSNIRKLRLHEPPNETKLHKRYRLLRQETLDWHHDFWLRHNSEFAKVHSLSFTAKYLQQDPGCALKP